MTLEKAIHAITPLKPKQKVVLNIMYSSRIVEDRVSGVLKEFGISKEQYNVLRILRGQKGRPANLYTIQQRMVHRMSNTTRLVDKLIEKNLVQRGTCRENRRKVEIRITEKGMTLLTHIDPLMENVNIKILEAYTPEELETLNTLLDKLQ